MTKHNRGYTLIEALISIALLSVILLGVYGVLHTGNTVTTNDNALLDAQQQARNAMDRLVREIRQSSTVSITVISADSDSITFTIPSATGIQYSLSGTSLVRTYPVGTTTSVASNIGRLKFTISGSLLTISVRADRNLFNKTISFPLVEQVRLRNV